MFRLCTVIASIALVGCATGSVDYSNPTAATPMNNVKVVNSARADVWARAIPELGKRFFTINNLDQSSGLVNVSYSGDPEKYVDCGMIASTVKNARGERTYNFPAAKASQQYEVMQKGSNGLPLLTNIDRKMALEGRVNLIFEVISPAQTRVTANTRYILTRTTSVTAAGIAGSLNNTDTVGVNSGQSGAMGNRDNNTITCVPTGVLERDILAAVQ